MSHTQIGLYGGFKVGVNMKTFFAGYYGLNANSSFAFQAVKNLSAHPTYLRLRLFCKCFGEFWVYLGIVFLIG